MYFLTGKERAVKRYSSWASLALSKRLVTPGAWRSWYMICRSAWKTGCRTLRRSPHESQREVLSAAREAGFPVFISRHTLLLKELMGVLQFR
jgi:hypothetical protein